MVSHVAEFGVRCETAPVLIAVSPCPHNREDGWVMQPLVWNRTLSSLIVASSFAHVFQCLERGRIASASRIVHPSAERLERLIDYTLLLGSQGLRLTQIPQRDLRLGVKPVAVKVRNDRLPSLFDRRWRRVEGFGLHRFRLPVFGDSILLPRLP